ncbi:hypothetical protein GCM10027612_45920 [Microbispora bryophytorum subsp. camponoti]
MFPVEDGRWIVTLTGTRGGEPPTDEQGFTAFARSLRHPIVADLMAEATPSAPSGRTATPSTGGGSSSGRACPPGSPSSATLPSR